MNLRKLRIYLLYSLLTSATYVCVTFVMDTFMHNTIDFWGTIITALVFGFFLSLFLSSSYFRFRI